MKRKGTKAQRHRGTKFISFFTVVLLFSSPVLAGDQAASFLDFGVGGRPAGMGGAFAAIAGDPITVLWNPAGLATVEKQALAFMSASEDEAGTDYAYLSFVVPGEKKLVAAFSWLGSQLDIPAVDLSTGSFFSIGNDSNAYVLSVSSRLNSEISGGINIKWVQEKLLSSTAEGLSYDLGLIYKPASLPEASFGISASNLFGKIEWNAPTRKEDTISSTLRMGTAWQFLDSRFTLALDASVPENTDALFHLGAEYLVPGESGLALRAGLDDNTVTTGLGLSFRQLNLDYAFRAKEDILGMTQRLSVVYWFR